MRLPGRYGAWLGTVTALLLTVTLILAIPAAAQVRGGGFHGGGHGFHGGFSHHRFHGGGVTFGIGIGVGWPLWYGYPYYGYPAYPYYGYPYYSYPAYPYYPYYGDPYAAYPPVQYRPPAPVAQSSQGCYDAYGNWVGAPCQPYPAPQTGQAPSTPAPPGP